MCGQYSISARVRYSAYKPNSSIKLNERLCAAAALSLAECADCASASLLSREFHSRILWDERNRATGYINTYARAREVLLLLLLFSRRLNIYFSSLMRYGALNRGAFMLKTVSL